MNSTKKIAAGLLSLAMVLTLVGGVAVANAQTMSSSFSRSLTVGSRGADVTELQAMLYANGFLSVSPTGYFGALTKAALAKWQGSVGITPASGYFGPITRGYIASHGTGGMPQGGPVTCPPGFTCTPAGGPVGGTLDNSDGSLSVSLSSYAGNTTIKKGETKDMVAVKLQATAGKVSVSRFDVRMNNRPWLYFSKITLRDTDGNVIATKSLSGSSDVTEITVGSDYLVRFEGLNYVVSPGMDKTLVVSGTVVSSTDKLSSNVDIIVSVPNSSIRTVNGKGYTDSLGLGTVAVSGTTGRTITLTGTGSTGNIVGKLNSSSPRDIVPTSTSGETNDVVLGIFDLKSENSNSTISTLSFNIGTSTNGSATAAAIFKNLRLTDGSNTWSGDLSYSGGTTATTTFTNLNIALAQDAWKTLTLKATIADQDDFTAGLVASTSLLIQPISVVGVDSAFNTVTATGANRVTGNDLTFTSNAVTVTSATKDARTPITQSNSTTGYNESWNVTLKNNSNNDLYISAVSNTAIATSSTYNGSVSTTGTTTLSTITVGSTIGGDVAGTAFILPSGSSRTFTLSGALRGAANSTVLLRVTGIRYGTTSSAPTGSTVTVGLDALTDTVSF
jgi:hypothetical protein